jgi:hypothetical protein
VLFRRRQSRSSSPRELEKLSATLGAAVDQFGREVGRHHSRRRAGQSRGSLTAARLSSLPGRRPWFMARPHPLRLPQEYRRGMAPTVLSRTRDRYGRPPYALEVEARAEGWAAGLRRQLLRLRAFLGRVRDSFWWRRSPRVSTRRIRDTRTSIGARSSGSGDGLLTVLVIATTAALGLEMMSARQAVAVQVPPVPNIVAASDAIERRIDELAYAIAVAEGYFAEGRHDGRTLPHLLNNPGSLKKPALGAAELPTWKDTGLVWFPAPDMGWAALRHQVRLMLMGTSGIYAHTDSLMSVGDKYADGDVNWGANVATTLGVPPGRTLGELAPRQ